ncbi:hypothetical protein Tco_0530426 [Tanacetum coccineum]
MSLSLAEYVIVAGADNRPSMLDKTNYSSWASRMLLYNKGKEHGKLLVDSVLNGPFQYETMVKLGNEITPATIRARTYTDLTDEEKIHESVDIKATNIVLQGLPQDIYNLVSHNEDAKQICDRVKLLVKGSELSLQERESKLYDDFDTFTSMPEETIHSYYMRQHEAHANEYPPQVVTPSPAIPQQQYQAPVLQHSYQAPIIQQSSSTELDSGLVIPSFNPSDDPIANLNKLMAFVTTTFGPCFPQINNQLRTLSNPGNQATIQDGRGVNKQGATSQARVVKCHNCQEEGDFARLCTKLKRPKNSAWFKEKMLLSEALESGAYLDLKQLAFLANNRDTVAVLMANLSSYDSDVLSYDISYESVQETQCSEQPFFDNNITNDSDIVSYEQYLQETGNLVVQSTSSPVQQDELLMSVIVDKNAKVADFEKHIHSLKLQLNATVESHKTLSKTVECLKKESKQKEDTYLDEVIDLQKKNKALDNVVYKMVIMKYLVKISKKARILELKQRHLKITVLTTNTPYPSRKIRRICSYTSQKTTKKTRINTPTTQPAVKGFHSPLDEGTHKSNPLPEGKLTDPQDIERNKQPAVKGLSALHLWAGTKYQDELKDDSDEEMHVTGEELDEEFLQSKNEETQHAHSNKTPTEDPISTEHQSPLPNKDHPESAKDKKTDALDSESSSWDKDNMITEEHVSKTADAEKEPEQEPQHTEPIPITIVMPIVTSTKTKIIGYSSRPQLTDHILEVQVLQPENPSHTTPKLDRGKGIARDTDESTIKPVPKSKEVCQDPDVRPELIKVIHEVTKEARVDPKALQSLKGDQEFIKKQDAKIKVLNKEHSKKVMKEKELWKKRIDQYRWTTSSRIKPENITNIHIHLNT